MGLLGKCHLSLQRGSLPATDASVMRGDPGAEQHPMLLQALM